MDTRSLSTGCCKLDACSLTDLHVLPAAANPSHDVVNRGFLGVDVIHYICADTLFAKTANGVGTGREVQVLITVAERFNTFFIA